MIDLAGSLLIAASLLFLPGAALTLPALRSLTGKPLHYFVVLSGGVGFALNALIFLLLDTLRVPVNPISLSASYAVFGGVGIAWFLSPWGRREGKVEKPRLGELPWAAALAGAFLVVLILRWIPLSGLPVPPGVDPVHHVAIVDLILRDGALPTGYEPYWPFEGFTYHFGFHAMAAALSMFSGLQPHESVLLLGPFLVALAALAIYVLILSLSRSKEAALVAAIATGLLSVFPAFYLNWGRLPQLSGIILAVLAMALLLELNRRGSSRSLTLVTALLVAGLLVTHYRMFLLLLFGALALLLTVLVETRDLRGVLRRLRRGAPAFLLAFAFVLPWVVNLSGSLLARAISASLLDFSPSGNPAAYSIERAAAALALPGAFWLAALSVFGAVATALRHRRGFVFLSLWGGLSWVQSSRDYLPVPAAGFLDPITWLSVSFVFQVAFVGFGVLTLLLSLRVREVYRRGCFAGVIAFIVLLGAFGTGIVPLEDDPLVASEDLGAFAWIEENLPPGSVFATNVVVAPFTHQIAPADAGAYITYFTGRAQLAPPFILGLERPSDPEYPERIRNLTQAETRVDSFPTYLQLRELGATHVYLGSRQIGPMNATDLRLSPWYRVVYDEANVTIAELREVEAFEPLVLRGGQDWSHLVNGYSVTQEWEPDARVLEAYTFEDFVVTYPFYLAKSDPHRLSLHLADFVPADWVTGQPLSGVVFEVDGVPLLEFEYGSDQIIWLAVDLPDLSPGTHILTIRRADSGLPFRISLGSIVVSPP